MNLFKACYSMMGSYQVDLIIYQCSKDYLIFIFNENKFENHIWFWGFVCNSKVILKKNIIKYE